MSATSGQPGSAAPWRSIAIGLVVVLVIGTGVVVWLFHRSDPKPGANASGVKVSKSPSPTSTPSPTPPKQTIARAIRQSRSAVVRIETTTCDTRASGSGFMVAPGLVVTVAHVVDGYRTVAVRNDSGVTSAVVVGIDPEHEVALVRLKYKLRGQPLTFAAQNPRDGSPLAVLGYPLGRPLTSTNGTVGALDRQVDVDLDSGTRALHGLVQFDAATNPGSSGGPLIDRQSHVLGMTEAGNNYIAGQNFAVSAETARPLVDAWQASPAEVAPASCPPSNDDVVSVKSRHADAPGLADVLGWYFGGLMAGADSDPGDAWALLTARHQGTYKSFDDFVATTPTAIGNVVLVNASFRNASSDSALVRFTSQEQPATTDTPFCSRLLVRYTMTLDSGDWLIDDATTVKSTTVECT